MGTLFLKLLSKHHVTNRSIQEIVDAFGEVARVQEEILIAKCDVLAEQLNVTDSNSRNAMVGQLVDGLLLNRMFGSGGIFRTAYTRNKFYSENFSYVSPVEISLQKNMYHTDSFYYYVPILDTLKALLNDANTYNAVFREKT